jgi:hypothetical protein
MYNPSNALLRSAGLVEWVIRVSNNTSPLRGDVQCTIPQTRSFGARGSGVGVLFFIHMTPLRGWFRCAILQSINSSIRSSVNPSIHQSINQSVHPTIKKSSKTVCSRMQPYETVCSRMQPYAAVSCLRQLYQPNFSFIKFSIAATSSLYFAASIKSSSLADFSMLFLAALMAFSSCSFDMYCTTGSAAMLTSFFSM